MKLVLRDLRFMLLFCPQRLNLLGGVFCFWLVMQLLIFMEWSFSQQPVSLTFFREFTIFIGGLYLAALSRAPHVRLLPNLKQRQLKLVLLLLFLFLMPVCFTVYREPYFYWFVFGLSLAFSCMLSGRWQNYGFAMFYIFFISNLFIDDVSYDVLLTIMPDVGLLLMSVFVFVIGLRNYSKDVDVDIRQTRAESSFSGWRGVTSLSIAESGDAIGAGQIAIGLGGLGTKNSTDWKAEAIVYAISKPHLFAADIDQTYLVGAHY